MDPKVAPKKKKKSSFSTAMLFASFGLVFLVMFDENLRLKTGAAAGFLLEPVIGFGGKAPALTLFFASVILVVVTTVIRHFLVDWVNMARVQEAMRSFQKEFADARKSNNTYKLKKLTDAQPEVMQLQASMTTDQMKPMAFTMLIVIPIFAWLSHFLTQPNVGHILSVPWNQNWDILANFEWFGRTGFLPRWILLYSLFGIPFGQIAQRILKLWEYRNVDLDGDGHVAGERE